MAGWRAALLALLGLPVAFAASPMLGALAAEPSAAGSRLAAGPELTLRVGEHGGFSRLVFDWASPVGYRLKERPGGATLIFDRAARLDLSRYRSAPPKQVLKLTAVQTAEGLRVDLSLPRGAGLRHFLSGPKVVLDVLAPGTPAAGAQQAPAKAVAAKPAAPVTRRPEPKTAARGSPESRAGSPSAGPKAKPARRKLVITYERPSVALPAPAPGARAPRTGPLLLRVRGDADTAAAAFRRGRYLWLVFDRPARVDVARGIEKFAPALAPVVQSAPSGATVLRFTAPAEVAPELRRVDGVWLVDLRPRVAQLEAVVTPEVFAGGPRPRVAFPLEGAGRPVRLVDPDLGDRLTVLPVTTPGLGLVEARVFPQFEALATYQGLVVARHSDHVRVALDQDGLQVTNAAGLLVTPELGPVADPASETAARAGRRLFDLAAWRRGGPDDYERNRQDLQRAVVAAAAGRALDLARVELARFYFAHGLATEALAVLQLIARKNKGLARDPELILLAGASAFLGQDYEVAARTVSDPALAGEPEAVLWRAALAAAAQDWATAAEFFDQAEPLIDDYVHQVRVRLRLLAAEARLGIGDSGGASFYLTRLRAEELAEYELAQLDFLEGRRLQLDGEIAGATDLWRQVAEAPHQASQARARLALIELGVEDGTLDEAAAIQALEQLRFLWRGDDFEAALLERLGALYAARGDLRRALHALRQAASHFPGSARAKAAAGRMRELFTGAYLNEEAAPLAPLKGLALYEEFKELTPLGAPGNQLIDKLIDRLVEVDLLGRAAVLLEDQMTHRLKGVERARAGGRLALIRLLDRQPKAALAALRKSGDKGWPEALVRQRRHLKARAFAGLERGREALGVLTGDDSAEALRLRAEILWGLRDWRAAAVALKRLIPEAPPAGRKLSGVESQDLVDLAVVRTLAGDRKGLDRLARRYGAALPEGPLRDSFALLTSDFGEADMTAVAERLAGVERIRAFMAGYRARVAEQGLSGVN